MRFSVLSYNLNYSRALQKIDTIIREVNPDIIALQEINTSEETLQIIVKEGYQLTDYSNSFIKRDIIYGIATFYRQKKIFFKHARSIDLPSSLYEVIEFFIRGRRRQRTVLKTDLTFGNNKNVSIYNVHFSPYTMNTMRIKQLKQTLEALKDNTSPTIILGDFNYLPYGRKTFEAVFSEQGLGEATKNITETFKSTHRFLPIRFKLDYILYKNLKHVETRKLPYKFSDHSPILSTFEI